MKRYLRHGFLSIMGSLKSPKPGIHIINSHYISRNPVNNRNDIKNFDRYLTQMSNFGKFITLEEASSRISNREIPKNDVLISFTFDDGFEECHTIIAPTLEKYDTKGAFFINANYIDSTPSYQQEFNQRTNTLTKNPMNWRQIKDLHSRGHLIGSHNLDHSNFAEISDYIIEYQVTENKRILESKLNFQCEHFAWTYGHFKHFPLRALNIVKKYHSYIYSATNYTKYLSFDGEVINRRHLEAYWPISHNRYFLSVIKSYK